MTEKRWDGKPGPPCQHCNGSTHWIQRLDHRALSCEDVACWSKHQPLRVDKAAEGLEGVEIIVGHREGRLQLRKGTTLPGWPLNIRRGWHAGAGGYVDGVRIVHVACPDGVLRWALMTQLEPFHG